jgi:hypothetical protein
MIRDTQREYLCQKKDFSDNIDLSIPPRSFAKPRTNTLKFDVFRLPEHLDRPEVPRRKYQVPEQLGGLRGGRT